MQEETAGVNGNEEELDSMIRHAKALTWVCVALFVVLDVIGATSCIYKVFSTGTPCAVRQFFRGSH